MTNNHSSVIYRPIPFIIFTFSLTWACAFFMAYQTWLDERTLAGVLVLTALDFLKSAAPLIAALVLLRKALRTGRALSAFLFGNRAALSSYAAVAALFIFQFFTFYLSRAQTSSALTLTGFLSVWLGQILLGGAMEEGGWRGYLQPAFENRLPTLMGVVGVSLVWACWHLPYFFLPNNLQTGGNFLFYVVTATATAFTLTAIHKMTGSVLLCTLFHGWQNAIVISVGADMGRPLFLVMFALQTAASIALCIKPIGAHRTRKHREIVR